MLQLNLDPFPVLQTARLVLRQITMEDAPALYKMRSDKNMMAMIARPLATCIEDVQKLIETIQTGQANNDLINWAISLKNDATLIGTIGYYRMKKEHYRAEIGYMLAKEHQGMGLMNEAVTEVIRFGFEVIKLHSIEAVIAPENVASQRVVKRTGFVQEGFFRESEFFEGKFISKTVYSLLTNTIE
jgi:[ribosomal protein S5]-alanine N-acetyltransferase